MFLPQHAVATEESWSGRAARAVHVLLYTLLGIALLSAPGLAQTLTVEPSCGIPGSTVQIGGSGWAEPQPVCDYFFLFDNAAFAPQQPDGLFGPPNRTATIPASATPGDHKIKVELRLRSDNSLLQCRQTKFKVVTENKDPWKDGVKLEKASLAEPDASRIGTSFNPESVCDVTPCTKLVFIQTRKLTGTAQDGTTRRVTYVEQGWANGANIDNDFTPAGVSVDRVWGKNVPYYGVSNPGENPGAATPGFSGKPTAPSDMQTSMFDAPRRPDASYPVNNADPTKNIVKYTIEFEANAFCAEGTDKGEFFGQLLWKWERSKGRKLSNGTADTTGTITFTPPTRNQPTQAFLDALARWDTNHATWQMPTPSAPTTGGEPCN